MKTAGTLSGWLVAVALAVAAVVRVANVTGQGDAVPAETAVSAAPTTEERQRAPVEQPEPQEEEPGEADEATPDAADEPGNAWNPPGEIDSVEGIFAFLAQSTPQERALGERLLAAYKAKDAKAVIAAAREALNCPDPKVCAMAVEAMGSMDELPQPEAAEILMGFAANENDYVKQKAIFEFSNCIGEDAVDDGAMSRDNAIDLFVKALTTIDFSSRRGDFAMALAFESAFGSNSMDVEAMDKAAAAFGNLAKSDDVEVAKLGRWVLSNLASSGYVNRDANLYDDAKIEKALAERRSDVVEAMARFPDNKSHASSYMRACKDLREEAKERFGDDAAAAAAWLEEEKEFVARRFEN